MSEGLREGPQEIVPRLGKYATADLKAKLLRQAAEAQPDARLREALAPDDPLGPLYALQLAADILSGDLPAASFDTEGIGRTIGGLAHRLRAALRESAASGGEPSVCVHCGITAQHHDAAGCAGTRQQAAPNETTRSAVNDARQQAAAEPPLTCPVVIQPEVLERLLQLAMRRVTCGGCGARYNEIPGIDERGRREHDRIALEHHYQCAPVQHPGGTT